jgi:hypothetical protein
MACQLVKVLAVKANAAFAQDGVQLHVDDVIGKGEDVAGDQEKGDPRGRIADEGEANERDAAENVLCASFHAASTTPYAMPHP